MPQSGKDPLAHGVAFIRPKSDLPLGDRMVNHMQYQSEEPIHEVFPGPILTSYATLQKCVIQVIRRHLSNK